MEGGRLQLTPDNAQEAKDAAAQAAQQQAPLRNIQVQTGGTLYRIEHHGERVSTSVHTAQSVNAGDDVGQRSQSVPSSGAADLVVSGHAPGSSRALSGNDLRPDSVVKINVGGEEYETSLAAAKANGWIVSNAAGIYTWASGAAPRGTGKTGAPAGDGRQPSPPDEQPEQRNEGTKSEPLDPVGHALLNEFANKVPGVELQSTVSHAIETGKEIAPQEVARIAQHLGVSQEVAQSKVAAFQASYQRQADAAVGSKASDVWEWSRSAAPDDLKQAMRSHVMNGDLSGYRGLASRFLENLDTAKPAWIMSNPHAEAMKPRVEANGRISIETPQGRMLWRVAVKAGIVKPFFK